MKSTLHVLGAVLMLSVCSCANLEHVNTFATTSVKALNSASAIGYSYTQSCEDFDCKVQNGIGLYFYPTTAQQLNKAYKDTSKCDCGAYIKADKALATINGVLSAYLTGLANLSDSKAVNYNYSNLVNAINADSAKLSLTGTEVTAIGNLATTVSNVLVNTYRRTKLKAIIQKTDPDVQIVLSAYIRQIILFKTATLGGDIISIKISYSDYLQSNDSKLSPYEKGIIFQDFLNRKAKLESYQKLIDNYVSALQKIKSAHAELTKDADHLTEDNVKELINGYSADIFSLITQFNQLKTSKQ